MILRRLLSTGEAAVVLGLTRDSLLAALRAGAPEPELRVAGRRLFNDCDLVRLRSWFSARGRHLADQDAGQFSPTAQPI